MSQGGLGAEEIGRNWNPQLQQKTPQVMVFSETHSNAVNTDEVSRSLNMNNNCSPTDHAELQPYSHKSNPSQTMPDSSTENPDLLNQHFLAEQMPFDQTQPLASNLAEQITSPNQKSKIAIHPPELIYPRSRYHGYIPPLPISKERLACAALLEVWDNNVVKGVEYEFVEFELTGFSIYMPDTYLYGWELRGLQDLASKHRNSCFLLDGTLGIEGSDSHYYVQGVPFKICSIGNYGEEADEVGDAIWLKSDLNSTKEIYYRLRNPAPEYARFHSGFLWLANLSKHFVDYALVYQKEKKRVSLNNFRVDFAHWARNNHGKSTKFQSWYREYGRDDFRQAIAANVHFLYKESVGVTGKLRSLHVWKETWENSSIKKQPMKEDMTVVTPYVYDCFSHLRFGRLLKPLVPRIFTEDARESEEQSLSPRITRITRDPNPTIESQHESFSGCKDGPRTGVSSEEVTNHQQMIDDIKVGDVVSVTKDGENSVWKDETSRWKVEDQFWYLYVQTKHRNSRGKCSFEGIWLYKPSDTSCAKMKYPHPKELFFSDNCTCGSRDSRIPQEEVIDIVPVIWHGLPSETDIFIRQTYLANDNFVTLRDIHKTCEHLQTTNSDCTSSSTFIDRFPIGQTILAMPPRKSNNDLEPYEVVSYIEEGSKQYVTLRSLVRRSKFEGTISCRPNELVYTNIADIMLAEKLETTCLVRFYTEKELLNGDVPAPYCRDGSSNAFIITKRLHEDGQTLIPIEENIPQGLIQGFDPKAPIERRQLNGLDLFCGGGNFGRGLEEGGALHNKWAVDLFSAAAQTYSANMKDPQETDIFFGSVNDLLAHAFEGNPQGLKIPLPGDVDTLLAGSPCQGYSRMNVNKGNEQSLRNQSLVASVVAYVDFYRPKYGLLENVLNMAQQGLGRDEDVLSQLICAIVGLGYQLQLFLLDSWSFGSSQARSRIFVSFAAPGCVPLEHPQLSHSHPPHVGQRGLGRLANGESFGSRTHCPTAFRYLTAEESIADLPSIGEGATSHCTRLPDHVLPLTLSKLSRAQIACIPTRPRAMNFWKTWNGGNGTMTQQERDIFPYLSKSGKIRENITSISRAWGRIRPDGLLPTVLVTMNIEDSRMGTTLHWDQQRRLTIQELRRAQSFPDDEVIIGKRGEQLKIIGNSVDRCVSMALGISLRNAWLKCSSESDRKRIILRSESCVIAREKLPKTPKASTSTRLEVVPSQSPKFRPRSLKAARRVPQSTASLASSSAESISSNLSGFDNSSSSESITNLRNIKANIQNKRPLTYFTSNFTRKSPKLGPSSDLSAKARELFARSISSYNQPAESSYISAETPRSTPCTSSPRNKLPASSRENHIILDNETDSEDTMGLDFGPRTSTLLHRKSSSHTAPPRSTSNLNKSSSKLSYSHPDIPPGPQIIDLTNSDSEHQARSHSPSARQTFLEIVVPVSKSMERPQFGAGRRKEIARKYVPVNNSQFNAYAETNRTMKVVNNGVAGSEEGMRGFLRR